MHVAYQYLSYCTLAPQQTNTWSMIVDRPSCTDQVKLATALLSWACLSLAQRVSYSPCSYLLVLIFCSPLAILPIPYGIDFLVRTKHSTYSQPMSNQPHVPALTDTNLPIDSVTVIWKSACKCYWNSIHNTTTWNQARCPSLGNGQTLSSQCSLWLYKCTISTL